MFTPPPSPLPRDFGVPALDTSQSRPASSSEHSPDSLSPFGSSSRSPSGSSLSPITSPDSSSKPSPTHGSGAFAHAASRGSSSISLVRPPAGKNHASSASASSRSSKMMTHARNSTIAVLAGDKAALARAVASSQSAVDSSKKAQGRTFRLVAFAVPLFLVAITVIAQRWRTSSVSGPTLHEAFSPGIVIDVWRRQEDNDVSASLSASLSIAGSSTNTGSASTPTNTGTPVGQVPAAPLDDAVVAIPTPFPQPFDTTMGNNFTSTSCSTFFATFTQSKGFRSCRSFGMLLANSHAWFSAARSATPAANVAGGIDAMNNLVWGTCHTNTPRGECETTMAGLESQIRTECRQELKETHALAVAALVGFSNWRLYRDLGCIINQRTNTYCYLEALNSNDAEDAYLYSLPLGLDIRAPKPTCSKCSQQVMATLREYATNATLPIARTYPDVQNATSAKCGQDYALPAVVVNAATSAHATLFVLLVVAFFSSFISLLL